VVVARRLERDLARVIQRTERRHQLIEVRFGIGQIRRRLPPGSSSNTWCVSFETSIATRTVGDMVEECEVMAGNLL
jgi:hypothetical protein